MSDLISFVNTLRRPRLLIEAARHGMGDYNRQRVLKRLTRSPSTPSPRGAVNTLLGVEEKLNEARRSCDATYSVARHIEVMIALLAEAKLLANPNKLRA